MSVSGSFAEIGLDDLRASGFRRLMMARARVALLRAGDVDLVEHDDVGELDLLDQQIDQGAVIAIAQRSSPRVLRKSVEA